MIFLISNTVLIQDYLLALFGAGDWTNVQTELVFTLDNFI